MLRIIPALRFKESKNFIWYLERSVKWNDNFLCGGSMG